MKTKAALFFYFTAAGIVLAADSSPYEKYGLGDFAGGLNTVIASHKLDPKFSPNLQNVFIHRKPGSIIRSNGYVTVGSTSVLRDGRFGFTAYAESGGKEFIVSDSSMVLSTQDFRTYIFISSALTSTVGLDCAQVRNKVWCTNGVDPVFNWNLTTHVKQVLDGTNGLPNVPRGRYIETWQERVWILNTSADGSSLDFSALVTTAAEILAPDDPRAWPSANRLEVGQGDGQVGTALFVYNGRLYAGKEASVWITLGGPQTSYHMYKIEPQVGIVSNDSVAFLDGLVNWKGKSGTYKFDGTKAVRITDGIAPDMEAVNDATNKSLLNTWDTQGDFSNGNFAFGSTATLAGFLQPISERKFPNTSSPDIPVPNPPTISYPYTISSTATQFTDWGVIVPTFTMPVTYLGYVRSMTLWVSVFPGSVGDVKFRLRNTRTNQYEQASVEVGGGFHSVEFGFPDQGILFTGDDINTGKFEVQVSTRQDDSPPGSNNFMVFVPTTTGSSTILMLPATTVQYMSEVTTFTSVTAWGVFDSIYNTNGGAVSFYLRTSTHPTNISTRTWNPVAPGTIINAPTTEFYGQWASTIASVSTTTLANIDNVTIAHIEGSSNRDRPFAIEWNREYWLSVATGTNNSSIQYVKAWGTHSNPDAWNRLQGQNIRSLFKDGNSTLYAGSASTGVFYRLDFGTNYDGQAIQSFYDTPDMTLGNNYTKKKIFEVWLDVDKSAGGTFDLGVSTNGAAMGFRTFSIDGTGRKIKAVKNFVGAGGYTWKFRFQNNGLDQNFGVHNALILYTPTDIMAEN